VLLDIAGSKGVPWLEPGTQIGVADLEAAEQAHGVTVGEGDILIVATGRDARRAEHGPWVPFIDGMAGLHPECVPWLHERNIAVLGCDGVSDVFPSVPIEGWAMPIHQCTLAAMGVHLLDNLRLDDLCSACAQHEQYDFQFTVAPLRVERGTGSPCNPIAVL
jgi:kynurenine formamidase